MYQPASEVMNLAEKKGTELRKQFNPFNWLIGRVTVHLDLPNGTKVKLTTSTEDMDQTLIQVLEKLS